MARPVVTLTTDFGTADTYVGAMKGVIHGINPEALVVDLTHDVPPQDVHSGAYLFATGYAYFPPGTVHVIVVDPGVGTDRRAIAVYGGGATFVCPDNGLLSYVLDAHGVSEANGEAFTVRPVPLPQGWSAYALDDERHWRHPVSATFHGRDVFAPVAAAISAGASPASMGSLVSEVLAFHVPKAERRHGETVGCVLHVDRFGNLITNIDAAHLSAAISLTVEVGGHVLHRLSRSYQDIDDGARLVAVIGSSGTVEVAVPNGSAAQLLSAKRGEPVTVRLEDG